MKSFPKIIQGSSTLPTGTAWLIGACMEARGKQDLWKATKPEVLDALRELAIVQSAESSNRIEGVTVEKDRLLPLLQSKVKPRDRSEEEVFGYRKALDWIHTDYASIQVSMETIKRLHYLSMSGLSDDAGKWKARNNEIIEILPTGMSRVRFVPLTPPEVPGAIEQLCTYYHEAMRNVGIPDLLSIAAFTFDFLCIHPFRDGNGRVSRLLSLLLLYKSNYMVGRFVSLERIIEGTKENYYEALKLSSGKWHTAEHDIQPFLHYFLGHLREAYRELGEQVQSQDHFGGGKSQLIKNQIFQFRTEFALKQVQALLPSVSSALIRKVLNQLKTEGKVTTSGHGRGARWKLCS